MRFRQRNKGIMAARGCRYGVGESAFLTDNNGATVYIGRRAGNSNGRKS
jgi:hypothetical protein